MKNNKENEELLDQKKLKELLHYNPLTGIFTWKDRPVEMFNPGKHQLGGCNTWNTRFAGSKAGSKWKSKNGNNFYIIIDITLNKKKRKYRAHRLAILYTDGYFPLEDVDHIDGDGLNNRRDNLREVTNQENSKNMPMYSNNTSGYAGVYWHKPAQKWHVRIKVSGKYIHGGYFTNKSDAIKKRKQLEVQYGFHKNHGRK